MQPIKKRLPANTLELRQEAFGLLREHLMDIGQNEAVEILDIARLCESSAPMVLEDCLSLGRALLLKTGRYEKPKG